LRDPLPISIEVKLFRRPGIYVHYPVITGLPNVNTEKKCNQHVVALVQAMIKLQAKTQPSRPIEMNGHFEVKTNERGILSILFKNHVTSPRVEHGYTMCKSLTFDLINGKQYELSDLFLPEQNYQFIISRSIQSQIRNRQLLLLKPFRLIAPAQDFYMADKTLVIYFPLYELTPIHYGIPMFPLNIYELLSYANPNGPLHILGDERL
jgi:hypothetical protein